MPEKDLKVRVSAKDDGFGATLRQTKADLDSILRLGGSISSTLTGGLLGGGVSGAVMTVIDKMIGLVRETAALVNIAQDLSISQKSARGISNQALYVGASSADIFGGIESSAQARADALAGDPSSVRAFERLGLTLKDIDGLAPDDLFFKIGEQLKGIKLDAERKLATDLILGGSSKQLLPYLIKGTDFRPTKEDSLAGSFLPAIMAGGLLWAKTFFLSQPNPFKADVDPVSTHSLEREAQTQKLRENNAFRQESIARSQLSMEEQVTDLVRQRLELNRQIEIESSNFKKEQLRGRLLDVEEEALRLRNTIEQARGKEGAKKSNNVLESRSLDELYRSGIFTGGRPVDLVETQRQQLEEARRQTDLLSSLPDITRKAL